MEVNFCTVVDFCMVNFCKTCKTFAVVVELLQKMNAGAFSRNTAFARTKTFVQRERHGTVVSCIIVALRHARCALQSFDLRYVVWPFPPLLF